MKTMTFKAPFYVLAGLSTFGLGHAAQAQTPVSLSLIGNDTPTLTAGPGKILTIAMMLTGGTNVGFYATRVTIDSKYLSFLGSAPFTETFGGFDSNLADGVTSDAALQTSSMDVSYGASNANVDNVGLTTLGTFQVQVISALPINGTFLTLTQPSGPTSAAPSTVFNADPNDANPNELTFTSGTAVLPIAAPEPSGALATFIGLAGLGLLAVRRRRAA